MSREDMVRLFSVEGLSKKAAVFDPKKLEWMNGQHLIRATGERLLPIVTTALERAGLAGSADVDQRRQWFLTLLDLLKVRARTIDDIVRQAEPFLKDDVEYDPAAIAKQWKDPGTMDLLQAMRERLAAVGDWSPPALERDLRELADSKGIGAGKAFQPLRVALTGQAASPGIFEVLELLGRERSLKRLDAAIAHIKAGAKG